MQVSGGLFARTRKQKWEMGVGDGGLRWVEMRV